MRLLKLLTEEDIVQRAALRAERRRYRLLVLGLLLLLVAACKFLSLVLHGN